MNNLQKKADDKDFKDIKVGMKFGFEKFITENDVNLFAKLIGDYNPLHMDENYAKNTKFSDRIVHGMLTSSLFSTLVGMYCPGKRCLYLSQTLNFKNPLKLNSLVSVQGEVTDIRESIKLITIKTIIKFKDMTIVEGNAQVTII